MPQTFDSVDHLLALDPSGRGIGAFFVPGGARRAAASLARGRRVLLVTGFAVGPGLAETDGPPGTTVLGRALRLLGKRVTYLSDAATLPLLEATLKALGEPVDVVAFPKGEPPDAAARRLLRELAPTHLVAVERPGRASDGDYRSARGESVAAWNPPVDALFVLPRRRITTVGIGDGGNEVGMGNVRARLVRRGPLSRRIASVVSVDHLVVAGTSNWGAYGVTAHLALLARRPLLHTPEEEARLIAACAEAGGVDGLTRRREATVDGLPVEAHAAFVELLRTVIESEASRGGKRT
ncbi:MAG: DUF4392 domain-containing protein [Candidatus Rokubacteria bacterium]|nr:DUF4392 domain-containing protein [Candidatus Rokubacteria bacterium]